jgi:glycosyltransferase involved in cell wall biosynthesis
VTELFTDTARRYAAAREKLTISAAIVHDWFQGYHGSERVVEAIRADIFDRRNEPDIYTFHAARELLPPELVKAIVHESRVSRLPGVRQRGHDPGRWRYLLPYLPHYFRKLPLERYDLVISSSHACAVNARTRDDALHVCYCHTPMRYAWMPGTDERSQGGLRGFAFRALIGYLRRVDREASRHPDTYIANSNAVRDRISRFYGRGAVVIHPPVDVHEFNPRLNKEPGRFLWVHRLVPYKNPELVAEAFRELPYRLTMVGVGPLEAKLRPKLPPNVELRKWVSRSELVRLYAQASGFLHVAEEDFGMTLVEALASGTPVVALDRGGARDIVRDGVDGVLINREHIESLRGAIVRVAEETWDSDALAARAAGFSREHCAERMLTHLTERLADRGGSSGSSAET